MSIYGIGAHYYKDVSPEFITKNILITEPFWVIGVGWLRNESPELHQFFAALKVGDFVYMKSFSPESNEIFIKAIGVIVDSNLRYPDDTDGLIKVGRNINWIITDEFTIPKPDEKIDVHNNSLYEESNPLIQREILSRVFNF